MISSSEKSTQEEISSEWATQVEIPKIKSEEDRPRGCASPESVMPKGSVDELERAIRQREKLHAIEMLDKAYWLLVGIMSAWAALSVLDFALFKNTLAESTVVKELVDMFKYLIPTIVGFVFASKVKKE